MQQGQDKVVSDGIMTVTGAEKLSMWTGTVKEERLCTVGKLKHRDGGGLAHAKQENYKELQ